MWKFRLFVYVHNFISSLTASLAYGRIFFVLLLTCFIQFGSSLNLFVVGKTEIVLTPIMGGLISWIQSTMTGEAPEPVYNFPDSLEGFGYYFTAEGKMRSKDGDEPFKFEVKLEDRRYNQKHYEALGEKITEYVYELLETECKLQRKTIPMNAEENEPKSFVFITEDFYTNKDKLLILIHGNGVVRAGQWARRLIINDCLDSGTQIPYIKWAVENGYAVIVANPNLNSIEDKSKSQKPIPIRGNKSPEEHTETMWTEFVRESPASHIAIVAHSYGGVGTVELSKNHITEFKEKVFAIAFTDSVHSLKMQRADAEVIEYYKEHVINWASAYDPLDEPLINTRDETVTVSAGTDKHEYTSYSSMNSIFKYFTEKYENLNKAASKDTDQSELNESDDQLIRKQETTDKQPISDQETTDKQPISEQETTDKQPISEQEITVTEKQPISEQETTDLAANRNEDTTTGNGDGSDKEKKSEL
ncbi:hypothetical protein ACF0H5_012968 [Mactra antiquata]